MWFLSNSAQKIALIPVAPTCGLDFEWRIQLFFGKKCVFKISLSRGANPPVMEVSNKWQKSIFLEKSAFFVFYLIWAKTVAIIKFGVENYSCTYHLVSFWHPWVHNLLKNSIFCFYCSRRDHGGLPNCGAFNGEEWFQKYHLANLAFSIALLI